MPESFPRRAPRKALKRQEVEQENSMDEIDPIFGSRLGNAPGGPALASPGR